MSDLLERAERHLVTNELSTFSDWHQALWCCAAALVDIAKTFREHAAASAEHRSESPFDGLGQAVGEMMSATMGQRVTDDGGATEEALPAAPVLDAPCARCRPHFSGVHVQRLGPCLAKDCSCPGFLAEVDHVTR